MKKLIAVMFLILFATSAWAGGNINFMLGQKTLDDDDWDPVDNHAEIGVMFDFQEEGWPISIAIDYLVSEDTDRERGMLSGEIVEVDFTSRTSELNIGIRKIWEPEESPIRPFVGGGFSLLRAEVEVDLKDPPAGYSDVSEDGDGFGVWLCGGVYWTLSEHFNLGLTLRYSQGEVTIGSGDAQSDVEAGGLHSGVFIGYHW